VSPVVARTYTGARAGRTVRRLEPVARPADPM